MSQFLLKLSNYAGLVFRLAILFAFVRIGEVILLSSAHPGDLSLTLLIGRSLNYDMLFVALSSLLFLPIFLILSYYHREAMARSIFKWLALLLIVFDMILTNFFVISGFLLPAFVLEFSISDVIYILNTEMNSRNLDVLVMDFSILLASYFVIFKNLFSPLSSRPITRIIPGFIYLIIAAIALKNTDHLSKDQKFFENQFQYFIGNSKPVNFIQTVMHWRENRKLMESSTDEDLFAALNDFKKLREDARFVSKEYPLLQINNCENVLGPFFEATDVKPNIVLVITESLSSSFSGTKTLYGSLTPFLDSLREEGLYWENFYSNADRTFGVLPNILGSLPYGLDDRGFINSVKVVEDEIKYANHLNLIKVLKDNDYKSHFFYGGWDGFDNMTYYMRYLNVDKKINDESFDQRFYIKKQHSKTAWGFDDKQLYRRSFEDLDSLVNDEAFINIYLTLSNHSPFALTDSIYFEREFQEKKLSKSAIERPLDQLAPISNEELASILFTDDALRNMFEAYKKRDDFDRTIFIIVGDHGGGSLVNNNKLGAYQIPLIMYSKMLKETATLRGISSHIDILPSLQCLLEKNYGLKTFKTHPFMGRGLDTSKTFNTKRMVPLMVWSNERASFILDNLVLEGDDVYYMSEDRMAYSECSDPKEIERIKKAHRAYLLINNYVLKEKHLWPSVIDLGLEQ